MLWGSIQLGKMQDTAVTCMSGGIHASSVCTGHPASAQLTSAAAVLAQSVYTPDVRLYHRAVVVAQEAPLRGLVRQLSIDQLDNEGRRVSIYENRGERTPLFTRSMSASVSQGAGSAGLGSKAAGGAVLEAAGWQQHVWVLQTCCCDTWQAQEPQQQKHYACYKHFAMSGMP